VTLKGGCSIFGLSAAGKKIKIKVVLRLSYYKYYYNIQHTTSYYNSKLTAYGLRVAVATVAVAAGASAKLVLGIKFSTSTSFYLVL
jgi:hypothetical protein